MTGTRRVRQGAPAAALFALLAWPAPGVASDSLGGQSLPDEVSGLSITQAEWASLGEGKVVVRSHLPGSGSDQSEARAAGLVLVRAPWTAGFAVVGDHQRAGEYSTCTKAVEVLSRESHDGREFVKTREVHKALWITMRYTVDFVHDPDARAIRWTLDPQARNDVKDNSGAWLFVPLSADRTLIVYRVAGVPGKFPKFMLDFFVRKDLPRYLSTLRRLVEAEATATAEPS